MAVSEVGVHLDNLIPTSIAKMPEMPHPLW